MTTLFSALILFIVILTTRIWGLGQTFKEFESPFLTGQTPYIVVKANTLPTIEAAIALKKDVVIWVDARVSADNVLFVLAKSHDKDFLEMKKNEQIANPTGFSLKGGKLSHYSWEELKKFYDTSPTLREVFLKFPTQRFLVNVADNTPDVNSALVADLKDVNSEDRTLIQSDTLVVMTSTKDIKPEWIYGTAQADLMRMMSFDSMWILSSTQFKGDIFIAPFSLLKRPAFNDDIIAEMKRRHKKIFLGPISSKEQLDDAKRLNADAYITEDLPQLLQWLQWLDQSQSNVQPQ